jgi:hypothetical protein
VDSLRLDRAGVRGAVAPLLEKAAAGEGPDGKRTVHPAAGCPAGAALAPAAFPGPEARFLGANEAGAEQ